MNNLHESALCLKKIFLLLKDLMRSLKKMLTCLVVMIFSLGVWAQQVSDKQQRTVYILWKNGQPVGNINATNGTIANVKIIKGKGSTNRNSFKISAGEGAVISVTIGDAALVYRVL